ncbi:MAG: hypothetical protein ACRDKU_04680 [Gaiellaceae bacterium]
MTVETALQITFAAGILLAAGTLAAAAIERAGPRTVAAMSVLLGAAATIAWVAFALEPSRDAAVVAAGLTACLLAALGGLALGRGLTRGRAIESQLMRVRDELDAVVGRELAARSEELEHTLARARADALSMFAAEQRQLSEERRRLATESEGRMRTELIDSLAATQGHVEQRLAAWSADLERAEQALSNQLTELVRRQRELISSAEARMAAEAERLSSADEEQRVAIARLREELAKSAHEAAAAADAELESHASERRRALHELGERLRARERDFAQRIEREQTDAARRIQSTFADVERRQVEQLERVLERAAGRFSDAAAQQFDSSIKSAREDAAQRLGRELDRSVQMFAREGESLLAERLAQVGDVGGLRLEKKLAQVAASLERQRDEFVSVTERRLAEMDTDFRGRLSSFAAEENAERAALEARLHELARRIDATLARAEERLTTLLR